jgi:hypothetical protein
MQMNKLKNTELVRSPNLFLLGAPKCGTTSLAILLERHDQIFVPSIKEPHFYSKLAAVPLTKAQYFGLYSKAPLTAKWLADCSTCGLFQPEYTLPIIEASHPGARYIVMIRSPIEMCRSLHNEELVHCNEDQVDIFAALQLQDARLKGESIPRACGNPLLLQYESRCSLGSQLEKVFDLVDRNRVHIIVLDDIRINEVEALHKLSEFLGVSEFEERLPNRNSARRNRSTMLAEFFRSAGRIKRRLGFISPVPGMKKLRKLNQSPKQSTELSPEMFALLQERFSKEISKLEVLLNRDFSIWRRL